MDINDEINNMTKIEEILQSNKKYETITVI